MKIQWKSRRLGAFNPRNNSREILREIMENILPKRKTFNLWKYEHSPTSGDIFGFQFSRIPEAQKCSQAETHGLPHSSDEPYLKPDYRIMYMDRLTELVLQDTISCGCAWREGDRGTPLPFSWECSVFDHCGWHIIYAKSNSKEFLFWKYQFSSKIHRDRRLQSWPLEKTTKFSKPWIFV